MLLGYFGTPTYHMFHITMQTVQSHCLTRAPLKSLSRKPLIEELWSSFAITEKTTFLQSCFVCNVKNVKLQITALTYSITSHGLFIPL